MRLKRCLFASDVFDDSFCFIVNTKYLIYQPTNEYLHHLNLDLYVSNHDFCDWFDEGTM